EQGRDRDGDLDAPRARGAEAIETKQGEAAKHDAREGDRQQGALAAEVEVIEDDDEGGEDDPSRGAAEADSPEDSAEQGRVAADGIEIAAPEGDDDSEDEGDRDDQRFVVVFVEAGAVEGEQHAEEPAEDAGAEEPRPEGCDDVAAAPAGAK